MMCRPNSIHDRRGMIDTSPMMMVPVFVILITFFAFMAVRNEMIKDDIRELQLEIEKVEKNAERQSRDHARLLQEADNSAKRKLTDAQTSLARAKKDVEELSGKIAGKSGEAESPFVAEADRLQAKLDGVERESKELRDELADAREELHDLRRTAYRRDDRGSRPRTARNPQEPVDQAPSPDRKIISSAEAQNALVLGKYDLARTRVVFDPFETAVHAEVRGGVLDVPKAFQQLVDLYYERLPQMNYGNTYQERYAKYEWFLEVHEELRDLRRQWLKDMKAAVDELEDIQRHTQRELKDGGYDKEYVSIYVEILEQMRKDLRDIDCKPPAEPQKKMKVIKKH